MSDLLRDCNHNHGEGYCIMQYASDDGQRINIWNARLGVAPFIVHHNGCEFRHVNLGADARLPSYSPRVGELAFANLTRERCIEIAKMRVERGWDNRRYPMRERRATMDEAVAELVESMLDPFGLEGDEEERCRPPMLVTVDDCFLVELARKRAEQ